MGGVLAQNFLINFQRDFRLILLDELCGFFKRVINRVAATPGELLDELLHLAFRYRAHKPIDRLAVFERINRRDGLHTKLHSQRLVLVNVDLYQLHFPGVLLHQLFDDRRELLARATPRRPEIDNHRNSF